MVKPPSGVLQPRNNLTRSGQNGISSESRDLRRRSAPPRRLLVESRSPFSKPRESAVFERQISPKRSRRDSRSASTLEGSPVLLDDASEDELDVLTQTSVSKRKRRRTDLNMAGGKDQQRNWPSSQRPGERTGVDALMDSSEYPIWHREGKLINRMQAASSNITPKATDMYPEDLVATQKLDLPVADPPQRRQTRIAGVSSRSDKGTNLKFSLKYCYARGIKMDVDQLVVHADGANRELRYLMVGTDEYLSTKLSDVLTVIASDSSQGKKIRLQQRASKPFWIDLEISDSASFDHLVAILESQKNVNLRRKKPEWLDAARTRTEQQETTHNATLDADLAESGQRHRERARRSAVETTEPRRRLSAMLEPNRFNERSDPTNDFAAVRSTPLEQTSSHLTRRVTRSSGGTRDVQNMAEEQTSRELRSGNHDVSDDTAALMAARHHDFGPKWKKPLVYPRDGKKRATVEYEDLLRLDDGEFLNDNIIGFYLRYLMKMIEDTLPQDAKRIYWFNSFFFERLAGLPRARGSINYDAVKRWTRDVDLFTYDYVVVPVNENAHWYLVLICNLPQLFESETRGPDEAKAPGSSPHHPIGIDESQELNEGRDGRAALKNFSDIETGERIDKSTVRESIPAESSDPVMEIPASPDDRNEGEPDLLVTADTLDVPEPSELFAERKVLSDITGTVGPNSSARFTAAHRKKKRASVRQFDLLTPALITLDSLGLTHPQTTRAIKQYLVQEAQDKKGFASFEESSLQGINARGIPKQDNWCDCGPYLLAYMDKFTKNPSEFVSKLLQKQFDEESDWPNQLRPSQMRSNIKSLILRQYKDQHSGARKSRELALPLASDPINVEEIRNHAPQERLAPIADAALRAQEQSDNIVKSSIEETSAAGPTVNHFEVSKRTRADAFQTTLSVDPTVIPDSQEVMNHSPILAEPLLGTLPPSDPADQMAVDTVSSPPALEEQLRRAATAGELTDPVLLDDEP